MMEMTRKSKVMENRGIQHSKVVAHRVRLRDDIIPYLRSRRRELKREAAAHRLRIQGSWNERMTHARRHLLEVKMKHRSTIAQHKRRIAELRSR
ncbi:MAG: hypothetical protein NQU42_00290 [Methanothrix sp.]|uniref:hypothetical protein n=1 Tax=Methanothrix sp. TaxID=90426 RepID=UPI0025E66A1F|nr:hypothetical protein [Methanothrix sp.]MCQ8902529.1 hypothetical protein [Methanothrix sp.]